MPAETARYAPPAFSTNLGSMYQSRIEQFLESVAGQDLVGQVQLIFTSPPFPLNRKKKYGNESGEEYLEWLADLAPRLVELLRPDGSLVIEIGNAWEQGQPTMSTLTLEALLAFKRRGSLELCQQFVWENPARLPSPVQWVNIERQRVKDVFTHLWWMSPAPRPKANNRNVLVEYSSSMKRLIASGKYNSGKRPSEYDIGTTSFLTDNGGSIPGNVLRIANTNSTDAYRKYCKQRGLDVHPARMPSELASFFIRLLTDPGDLVFDPFGGSCTTGACAEALQRRWVVVEPVQDYVQGSKGRFLKELNLAHIDLT